MMSIIVLIFISIFWFLIGFYFGLVLVYIFLHFIFPKINAGFLIPLILALITGYIVGLWGYHRAEIQFTIQNPENQSFFKDGWYGLSKIEIVLIFTILALLGLLHGVVVMIRDMNIANSIATGITDAFLSVPVSAGLVLLIGDIKNFYRQDELTSFIATILIFGIFGVLNIRKQLTDNKNKYRKAFIGFGVGFLLGWMMYHVKGIIF